MNIAMMVRAYLPVPRPVDMIYAPIDLAVALSESLAKRGHHVDFFSPTGSKLKRARLQTLNLRPLARTQEEFRALLSNSEQVNHYVPSLWDRYMVNEMYERANNGDYDILHFHHPEVALPSAKINTSVPTIYTLHDPVYPWYKELFEMYHSANQHYVSISDNQRRDAPDLPYIATVYNGVDPKLFSCNDKDKAEDYLLFAGRVVPEKGVKEAVQIAQQTGHRLLIIGPVYTDGQGYFDQYIKPHLNDKILYLGYIEQKQLSCYYKKAKALLTPIQWEEPFGLTTVEAMASGTPVISLRRGAAPEIIQNGKTGFVVDSIGEMVAAVQKVDSIDRAACRKHAITAFDIEKMVDGYEAAYDKILRKRKKLTRQFVKTQLKRVPKQLKDNLKRPHKQLDLF